MQPSPLPPKPPVKLPSPRVSAVLAASVLAVGIALGALIGPAPASSLASETRAAAVARVLALLALDDGGASAGQAPIASDTGHAAQRSAAASPGRNAGPSVAPSTGGGASETRSTSSQSASQPSANSRPAKKGDDTSTPAAGSGESKPARLAPVAHVWLIVLPYGEGFASLLGQSAAAPYTTGTLVAQGTLLSAYSALQASALASAATLLPGQIQAAVSTIVAPCPAAPGASSPAAPTTSAASAPAASAATAPCAMSTEPAGAQAADAFLHEVVPQIEASAGYREGGLIAIAFAASGEAPGTGAPATAPAIAYPAGTQVSTASAAGASGALLLSPFLAKPGARLNSAFDQPAPRRSLEELLKDPSKTAHR